MPTITITSNAGTVSNVLIPDMGVRIPSGGGSQAFQDMADLTRMVTSEDLVELSTDDAFGVGSSTLVVSDELGPIDQGDVEVFLRTLFFVSTPGDTQAIRVTRTTNQVLIPPSTDTLVQYNVIDYDPTSSWNNTQFRYIPGRTGIYAVKASACLGGLGAGVFVQVSIRINGVVFSRGPQLYNAAGVGGVNVCGVHADVIQLANDTDYIDIVIQHNNLVGINLVGDPQVDFVTMRKAG